jgi:protein-disulfide isomerase
MTQQKQQFTILGITVAVAIIAVLIAIFISNSQSATSTDVEFTDIPQERLSDGGFILGDPSAPIIIVEFADFLCPHCQNYKPTINRIIEEFVTSGQARLEFRMLPTQTGSDSLFRLAECIDDTDEGSFWQAHDEFFALAINNTDRNDIGRIAAENLGISYAEILQCADDLSKNNTSQYLIDRSLASPVGVTGTPAIRVRLGGSDTPMQAISNSLPSFDMIEEAVLAANALP